MIIFSGKLTIDDVTSSAHSRISVRTPRLGGFPIIPTEFMPFFKKEVLPKLQCTSCQKALYLVAQFCDPSHKSSIKNTTLKVYYIFLCNSSACLNKTSQKCSFAFSIDVNSELDTKFPEEEEAPASNVPGQLEIPQEITLDNLDALLAGLQTSIKPGPPMASSKVKEKGLVHQDISSILLEGYPVSFPVVSLQFKPFPLPLATLDMDEVDGDENEDYNIESENDTDVEGMENFQEDILTEEFYRFEHEISKEPWQCVRVAPPSFPLPSSFIPEGSLLTCDHCKLQPDFVCQIMPAFFQCIDPESYYSKNENDADRGTATLLELLDTKSMEWSTLLMFSCPFCPSLVNIPETQIMFQEIFVIVQLDI